MHAEIDWNTVNPSLLAMFVSIPIGSDEDEDEDELDEKDLNAGRRRAPSGTPGRGGSSEPDLDDLDSSHRKTA
jgi:hypothetical protein